MTRLQWASPGSYESHVEREKGYSAMNEDKDYGPLPDRVDGETALDIAATLNSIQFFDKVHDIDLTAAARTILALLAERDRLVAENQRLRGTLAE